MNSISPFEGLGISQPVRDSGADKELGQDDFMSLMIAQFKNQDPMKPMENGDFLGQLAQFGTVSGIDELNGAFAGLQGSLQSDQALQAANLVGRHVVAETDSGYLPGEGSLDGVIELESSAGNVQVDVVDDAGQLLRRLDLGQQPAGNVAFSWDGRDADGELMPAGQYSIAARVMRGTETESAPVLVEADIESVTLGGSGNGLTLNLSGGDQLTLAQIRQIN